MELHSDSFPDGGRIATRFGKKFENVSPELHWSGLPDGADSLLLVVHDLHPVARGYVHWVVVDIPAAVSGFPEDAARGDLAALAREIKPYAGPFPPSGTHEYEFELYALGSDAPAFPSNATLEQIMTAASDSILGSATMTASFTKP